MKESGTSKVHISSNFILSISLLIMLRHPITKTITTLQHFATLHHTSPNYTSLHLSTLVRMLEVTSKGMYFRLNR